jgi:hypothetical protein
MKASQFLSGLVLGLALLAGHAAPSQAAVFTSQFVPGYCLDVNMSSKQVALWNCHGGPNQNLSYSGYGAVKMGNECLDALGEGKPLVMRACNNSQGQKWGYDKSAKQFKNEQGWCADIQGGRRDRGTPVIAWKCGSQANQKWSEARVVPISQASSIGLSGTQLQQLQSADSLINRNGGNIVAQGAGNIVAQGAGNIVAQGAGNIVAAGAGNLIVIGN